VERFHPLIALGWTHGPA